MSVALVTGGGRGIGAAVCRSLAEAGWSVVIHSRKARETTDAFLADLPGGPHGLVYGDIARPEDAARIIDDAVAQLDTVDLLVNNAGVYVEGSVTAVPYEDWLQQWNDVLSTNVLGTANVSFAATRHFLTRPQGPSGARIITVGSRGAFRGEPDAPAYGASKAAVHSLTQSLAASLGGHGISVAAVAPGFIRTDLVKDNLASESGLRIQAQSPFGRVGEPEEVASAVAWLASPGATWASGTIIDLNGASYFR